MSSNTEMLCVLDLRIDSFTQLVSLAGNRFHAVMNWRSQKSRPLIENRATCISSYVLKACLLGLNMSCPVFMQWLFVRSPTSSISKCLMW